MLTLLLGTDWTANRNVILDKISQDVSNQKGNRILIVPELISHDTERRLCESAGNTASRFAEVLTFTRLVKRVSDTAGCGVPECLDNGGRLVAMASAVRQLKSKLKAYASVETRPDFLTGLLDAVDEFKRCCISPADLMEASQKTQGSFAQKLEELSLILEAYDTLCARGKRDPRDQMSWLLEQLEDCDFAKDHTFYIDGFPDFTRQHSAILGHLIAESGNVTISLTCDSVDSDEPAFEKAANTAKELLLLAKNAGVEYCVVFVPSGKAADFSFLPTLFRGKSDKTSAALSTYHTESVIDECHAAAENIAELIRSGCRYRDFSVVCTDMDTYGNLLNMVFSRYGIPVYQSGTESVLDKTVITTVLSAIDVVANGFEIGDVLRYLRSALSPLDILLCDKIENYAIIWNITGSRWFTSWENHPAGLSDIWTDADRALLAELNWARETAITPLMHLNANMKKATSLGQLVEAIYSFLEEIKLDKQLEKLSAQLEQEGDLRGGQILNQLWEILLSALEQLYDMLGDTHWDMQTFAKLLKLLLSQYDVGTIPAVLDAVMVGPMSAMRCQMPKYLFVLGACEGNFPGYSGSTGVLSDQERTELRQLGIPLTGGAMEGLQAEFFDIYGVFCGAQEHISVSYSEGQPSFLYRRICDMAGGEQRINPLKISCDISEIAAYLARNDGLNEAKFIGVEDAYWDLSQLSSNTMGDVSSETIQNLYGTTLRLSASQVDKLADCRMAYFLRYGLKLKERKPVTVDPAEFGTYVHAVLEETGRKVMELGGFHNVSLEDTLRIANNYSEQYITQHFSQIDSQRIRYLFRRNVQELEMVVSELWQELNASGFEPVAFEHEFDSIAFNGEKMNAVLHGYVDRVDAWDQNGQIYYRVVDYKTGRKDFDYCDVYNGLGLQMLLYLFALEQSECAFLGVHPVPSGVQYFPARVPVVPVDARPDDAAVLDAREKLWKRKGLLLADESVLNAMEPGEKPVRLSYTRKKDGTISGDIADRDQLRLLKGYIFALLGKMVDDIASGCVSPNPYTRGSRHNACAYCPYDAVCHGAMVEGRRDYAAMNAQEFWDYIEKEMRSFG